MAEVKQSAKTLSLEEQYQEQMDLAYTARVIK
jgi:hypothetical protein